ncbi:MAG: hypothetical protein ACR2QK_21630 [Acidimicrobiales bacterium]
MTGPVTNRRWPRTITPRVTALHLGRSTGLLSGFARQVPLRRR